MGRPVAYALLVGPAVLIVAAAVHLRVQAAPGKTASHTTLSQTPIVAPASWVAFRAEVHKYHPGGPTIVGSFYRASDGSTRLETRTQGTQDSFLVSIKKVATAQFFVGRGDRFEAHPMDIKAGELSPPRLHAGMPGLSLYKRRLDIAAGGTGSLASNTGFIAYQRVDANGSIGLFVPELNFLEAVMQNLASGVRVTYTNIVMGDQPPSLFEPPPGATLTYSAQPRGIEIVRQ